MIMCRVQFTVFLSLILACAPVFAQQDAHVAGPQHGVSSQYERPDSFPVYDVHPVDVSNKAPFYSPDVLTIHVGDVVRWNNLQLSDIHTVIEHDGHFNSSEIKQGEQWCYHFVAEGDYTYSCRFHPWMKGVIHVERRDVELHGAKDTAAALASFRATHPESVIDAHGDAWLAGTGPGKIERIDASGAVRPVHVAWEGALLHPVALRPVAANDSHLFIQAGSRIGVADLPAAGAATANLHDWIDLPAGTTRIAPLGAADASSLWLISADRKTLLRIDLKTRAVRPRVFDPGSTLAVVLASEPGHALVLDSARGVLLKAGPEWTTEIALPRQSPAADEMAVDAGGGVWIKSHSQPEVVLVRQDGSIEVFHIPREQQASLVGLGGSVMMAGARAAATIVAPPASSMAASVGSGSSCSQITAGSLPATEGPAAIVISKGGK